MFPTRRPELARLGNPEPPARLPGDTSWCAQLAAYPGYGTYLVGETTYAPQLSTV